MRRLVPILVLASAALLCFEAVYPAPADPTFARGLRFAGYDWLVKGSKERTDPQDNYFSDSQGSVFVDGSGALHLRIRKIAGRWNAAEVLLARSLGYGSYRFELASRIDELDPNVIAGFFTWSDNPSFGHREIDIEFSRWGGQLERRNAQYVVQPASQDSIYRFLAVQSGDYSSHEMAWAPAQVAFDSRHGHQEVGKAFASLPPMAGKPDGPAWTYRGDKVPPAGGERFRINFYLFEGKAPTDALEAELVVSAFSFAPR